MTVESTIANYMTFAIAFAAVSTTITMAIKITVTITVEHECQLLRSPEFSVAPRPAMRA